MPVVGQIIPQTAWDYQQYTLILAHIEMTVKYCSPM